MTEKSEHIAHFWGRKLADCPAIGNALRAVCLLVATAGAAEASQFEVFTARCLDPFEHFSPPVLGGLEAMETGQGYSAYGLPEGFVLIYETEPEDAQAACTVLGRYDRSEALRFEVWALGQVEAGRYEELDAGRWLSTTWIEPKVAVELSVSEDAVAMRVMETDLES